MLSTINIQYMNKYLPVITIIEYSLSLKLVEGTSLLPVVIHLKDTRYRHNKINFLIIDFRAVQSINNDKAMIPLSKLGHFLT